MDVLARPYVRVDRHLRGDGLDRMAADVLQGLRRPLKELPPKYFYDARGSELFDAITELPEYYPTRAERALLERHAADVADLTDAEELVELGSGSAAKTRLLLDAMAERGTLRRYVPVDVTEAVVERCAEELTAEYPGLSVHGVVGDFERHLGRVPPGRRRLFAFLGGTIGNLPPERRALFLEAVRSRLGPDDALLLGTDLVKDVATLEAAYNDRTGVTAEFNRNVLRVINAGLGADFDPDAFDHVAFYDQEHAWIEMRLRARGAQRVRIPGAGMDLALADGEEIRTELSAKFTPAGIRRELVAAGMELGAFYGHERGLFGLALALP